MNCTQSVDLKIHVTSDCAPTADFAKLLQSVGVDSVIAVDLQRPGQGHEGCFFDNMIPVETIHSTRLMADYCYRNFTFENPLVIVASNAGCMKKSIVFRDQLIKSREIVNNLNQDSSPIN